MWNEEIETLNRKQVCALEAPLIADQINYVYHHSSYYRDKFDRAGIDPSQINGHEWLADLPFTEKADITAMQQNGALFGQHQCADFDHIVRVTCTGGSSGEPTRLGWTQNDINIYNEMGARALWAMGCRSRDFVISCFNYSMYAGGIMDHGGFETLGAAILPYGIGNSERLLEMLSRFPTRGGGYSIYLTPSYAARLADRAEAEGIDLHRCQVQRGYFSGEAGLLMPGYRDKIEAAWGMHAMDMYGAAELGVQSGECEFRRGLHYSCAGLVAVELIDPDRGEIIAFADGAEGELVYTTLRREACPLIRLRSHDIVRINTEPCECGRHSFRFEVLGRSDDMFVVKGMNVFPLGVQETLLAFRPQTSAEFFIELPKPPPIDYPPRLCLEVTASVGEMEYEALTEQISQALQRQNNFSAAIELVAQGSITSMHKTKRLYRSYLDQQAPALDIIYRRN